MCNRFVALRSVPIAGKRHPVPDVRHPVPDVVNARGSDSRRKKKPAGICRRSMTINAVVVNLLSLFGQHFDPTIDGLVAAFLHAFVFAHIPRDFVV